MRLKDINIKWLRTSYKNLSRRERIMVVVGSVLAIIILGYLVIVYPISKSTSRLERLVKKEREELEEMLRLKQEYIGIAEHVRGMRTLPPGFSIISHLDSLGNQAGVKIDSIKPGATNSSGSFKEIIVDVKINKITLYQLMDFLYKIEKNENYPLSIKRMNIRPTFKDPQYLEVSFQIFALQSI